MELDWWYFRRLYEGLLAHDDGDGGCRAYLSGRRSAVADHLAELAALRKRERVPVGGYTGDDEQLWRIMKLYGLSRVSDYLVERCCAHGGCAVHTEFFLAVGLTPFEHAEAFSPFHHEVFAVVQDPAATGASAPHRRHGGHDFDAVLHLSSLAAPDRRLVTRLGFELTVADVLSPVLPRPGWPAPQLGRRGGRRRR